MRAEQEGGERKEQSGERKKDEKEERMDNVCSFWSSESFVFITFGAFGAPKVLFYNVWSLWGSKSFILIRFGAFGAPKAYFSWPPKKLKKPFKINGLGVFLGTHLAPLWARTRFFDRPMVAHHGPSEGIRNSHFSNIF